MAQRKSVSKLEEWVGVALRPFEIRHIEYFLRFLVIPVTITGLYLGLISDRTLSFYPADGVNYHALEKAVVMFAGFSYLILNWAYYLCKYTGKYDGPREDVTFTVWVSVFLVLLAVGFAGFFPDFTAAPLTFNDLAYFEAGLVGQIAGQWVFLGIAFSVIISCLEISWFDKEGLKHIWYVLQRHVLISVLISLVVLTATVLLLNMSGPIANFLLLEFGFLDPFRTFQSILFALLHGMMIGIWLSLLSHHYKVTAKRLEDSNS